jgi:hypothetical protein
LVLDNTEGEGVAQRIAPTVPLVLAEVGLAGVCIITGSSSDDHHAGSTGDGRQWVRTNGTPFSV